MNGAFDGWLGVLTFATGLGCGLIAGALFAFSAFVMPALARLPAAQGIAVLAAVDAASAEGATLWASYLKGWTAWNHVRTAAALGAAALLTLALSLPRPGTTP